MIKLLYPFLSLICLIFLSCERENEEKTTEYYLHLAHTRTNSNPKMDSLVEKIDYNKFDMLWLGGDLANLTSVDDQTMNHVDSIFDLGNENTLWSLGNHDYSDIKRVEKYTNRTHYYSFFKNDITFVVLDTQDSLSNIMGAQKEYLFGILDTIRNSSHLILLHHKLIWMYDNPELEPQISDISNAGIGDCFYCINPNNFYEDIYPELVITKQNGIEVICIGGDIGFNAKEFEYLTKEGIYFLASGIKFSDQTNKAIVFTHQLDHNDLQWDFKLLSDL